MKFGKRLRREAHQPWLMSYMDYKVLKAQIKACAIKAGVAPTDVCVSALKTSFYEGGEEFFGQLHAELNKVNVFFTTKERELEEILSSLTTSAGGLSQHDDNILSGYIQLCKDLDHLRKFVVMNYLAVRKIVKKYDKQTKQPTTTPVMLFLHDQPFYKSLTLANVITKAQCLGVQIKQARGEATQFPKEDFLCPVCLDILSNPVVLSCAHRFCWTCLANASMFTSHNSSCPVCRKQQSLDPRDYTVDSLLMSFIRDNVSITPINSDSEQEVLLNQYEAPNPDSKIDDSSLPLLKGEEATGGGFFYFFQQEHKPATSIKLFLVQSQLTTTDAFSFVKQTNANMSHGNYCVLSTPPKTGGLDKIPNITATLAHTAESTKVPYVSFAEETALGTLLVLSFRSPKSAGKHNMPLLEDKLKDASSVYLVASHCTFEQMDEVVYPMLLKNKNNKAATVRHLFLLSSPKEYTGTWRNIPFTALRSLDEKVEGLGNVSYTEVVIKEDLVMVKPPAVAVVIAPSVSEQQIISTTATTFEDSNFKFVSVAYVLFFICVILYTIYYRFL